MGYGGVDSGRMQRGQRGPGVMPTLQMRTAACNYTMNDGKPCGCVFTSISRNRLRCDRHLQAHLKTVGERERAGIRR